jgi:hypothetical protein
MDVNETQEPKSYVPPSELPLPLKITSQNPIPAVILGLVAASVLGVALFAISNLIYVYILYNAFIGIGIGMAIGIGIQKGRYTNPMGLLGLTIVCSLLVYVVYNFSIFYWVLRDFQGPNPGFFVFLQVRAENDTLFRGIKPGTIGNVAIWLIEAGITWFYAFKGTTGAVQREHIEAVPQPVTELVLHFISEGRGKAEIENELGKRGWTKPEDQQKAFGSAAAVIQAAREARND